MPSTRDLFAAHNLRCTQQRIAVYDALHECASHPTAEELYRMVRSQSCPMSLATVYNTLEAFNDAGLIRRMPTTSGCCRYDADTSAHLHVCFRDTSEVRDLPDAVTAKILRRIPPELLSELHEELEQELGIAIDGVSIQLLARHTQPVSGGNGESTVPGEEGTSIVR